MGNTVSSVPYGAHTALLNLTLNCSTSNSVFTAPFDVSVTAPLASDTEIYYSDVLAQVDFGPAPFPFIANVTVFFSTNVAPSTFSITTQKLINSGDRISFRVPSEGVAVSGPFQMTNNFADLKVVGLALNAFNNDLGNIDANCNAPANVLISTANAALSSADTAPAIGGRAAFPATPAGSKSEIANLPLSCSDKSYNFTLQGTIPASVNASSKFSISNVNTFLTTSVGTQYAFVAQYGRQNGADVPGIVAQVVNASPQDVDIARDFTASDLDTSNPLSGGRYTDGTTQDLTIAAPRIGTLSKTFTAGSTGYITALVQSIAGTLNTNDGSLPISCSAASPHALLRTPIV